MLGRKEDETEREEAIAAAQALIDAEGMIEADDMGLGEVEEVEAQRMDRDLDDDVPNADVEGDGLIEEGEEWLEEGHISDEEAYLAWNLDGETPDSGEGGSEREGENLRTDPEEEDDNEGGSEVGWPRFVDFQRTSTPSNRGEFDLPHLRSEHQTETTQRRFLRRWSSSGNGSELDYGSVAFEDIEPAAVMWQEIWRRRFGRMTPGRMGEPGDSLS